VNFCSYTLSFEVFDYLNDSNSTQKLTPMARAHRLLLESLKVLKLSKFQNSSLAYNAISEHTLVPNIS